MKKFILTCAFVFVCIFASAQMAQFQALYIYNFAKNVSWPQEDSNKDLSITIIGDNDLFSELSKLAKTKMIGTRKVVVNQSATATGLPKSDIIYLGETKSSLIGSLVSAQQGNKTLIVCGKKDQCANGAGISFLNVNGKLNFQISNKNISSHGLQISNKLVTLGIAVD